MLSIDQTALILIDYQGKLASVMHGREQLHEKMLQLIQGMKILDVPIVWLEQYPKGLGPTEDEIREMLHDENETIAKMNFSACGSKEVQEHLQTLDKKNYLVAGIEAHVCVYQTVCDLLSRGKHVEFVQDAISSRTAENKQIAINKMSLLGAYPTSVEMVLFELMKTAEHPKFKKISSLIK